MREESILHRGAYRLCAGSGSSKGYRGVERFQLDSLEPRLLFCADGLHDGVLNEHVGTLAAVNMPVAAKRPRLKEGSIAPPPATLAGALPLLHSYPMATAKLFLDFDGDSSDSWGGFKPGVTPAYDQDNNPTSYSGAEQQSIRDIWARVAEKFSLFNIDVTTEDPGNLTDKETLRVVIGGTGAWLGVTAGGVAYVGGFANGLPNTVWVFSENLGNGAVKYVAEAAAHEAGHGFGLLHQGMWSARILTREYNPGNGFTAPIMGNSFHSERGLWWYGTATSGPNDLQNDVGVIAGKNNGFGYRKDDYGNGLRQASALAQSGSTISGKGVIEKRGDLDVFSFKTGAGTITLKASTLDGGMLDLKLELRDATGKLIQSADTASAGESLSANVASGTYYAVVSSHGGYGDLGQYTIAGDIVSTDGDSKPENPNPNPPKPPTEPPSTDGEGSIIRWPFWRFERPRVGRAGLAAWEDNSQEFSWRSLPFGRSMVAESRPHGLDEIVWRSLYLRRHLRLA